MDTVDCEQHVTAASERAKRVAFETRDPDTGTLLSTDNWVYERFVRGS